MTNPLHTSAIHVWHIHAVGEHLTPELHLTPEELARAKRFHDPQQGRQWRYFHCALRQVLARYTDCASQPLRFGTIEQDKPVLLDFPELHFNLSHTASRALLAVTRAAPVGIDIEQQRQLKDREAMIRRYFSVSEQEQLAAPQYAEKSVDKDQAFFRLWTRKEAIIKANGLGLGIALDSFDVPSEPIPTWRVCKLSSPANGKRHYRLQDVEVSRGYAAAIALQSAKSALDAPVSVKHFNYSE
ncbi:4'-phosphopantetheinyl transferase family protein [Candidatus Litorirhabdus singularis]|uniref:4'-phosphopantetheinyl transferase family protein n=1 Tax=Candidatus Litorirhabdus singularis TaxID=2518993 RepID=UPI00242F17DF|nr:4'-phosphopantetheinyl transferase superfamily protein [Candidatus Litorirhabdus singularis]